MVQPEERKKKPTKICRSTLDMTKEQKKKKNNVCGIE